MNPNEVKKPETLLELKDSVSKGLRDIYSTKIESDLGIKLNNDDWGAIDSYLAQEALKNPNKIKKIETVLFNFKNLPEQINKQVQTIYGTKTIHRKEGDETLKRLEMQLAATEASKPSIEKFEWSELEPTAGAGYGVHLKNAATRTLDWLTYGAAKMALGGIKAVRTISPDTTSDKLAEVRAELKVREARAIRKNMELELEKIKTKLFDEHFEPAKIVAELVKKKIEGQFKPIMDENNKPVESLSELIGMKTKLEQINPKTNVREIAETLNIALEARAAMELHGAIKNMTSMQDLEEKLKPFLESNKTKDFLIHKITYYLGAARAQGINSPKLITLELFLRNLGAQEIARKLRETPINPIVEQRTVPRNQTRSETRRKIEEAFGPIKGLQ